MQVSIVIINYKTYDLTYRCIQSILQSCQDYVKEYEILVVDNDSQDLSYEKLKELENDAIQVYQSGRNGGFAFANNIGASYAKGDYLLFLNSDTIIYNDVFFKMIDFLNTHFEYGVLSCLMEDAYHQPLVVGHPFENVKTLFLQTFIKPWIPDCIRRWRGQWNHTRIHHSVQKQDWVCGACFLIRTSLFWDVDGWDEAFFMYMEDEDLCFKVQQKGYAVGVYPLLGLQHMVGKSAIGYFSLYHRFQSARLYFYRMYGKENSFILCMLYMQVFLGLHGQSLISRLQWIQKLKKETCKKIH